MGASLVIVVAGLREGASILLPFALALFLAVMSMPLMFWLQLRRVPPSLAIVLTMLVMGAIFGALIMLGTQAVADLQDQLPGYRARVVSLYASWVSGLSAQVGIPIDQYLTFDLIDPGAGCRFRRQNRCKGGGLPHQHVPSSCSSWRSFSLRPWFSHSSFVRSWDLPKASVAARPRW